MGQGCRRHRPLFRLRKPEKPRRVNLRTAVLLKGKALPALEFLWQGGQLFAGDLQGKATVITFRQRIYHKPDNLS